MVNGPEWDLILERAQQPRIRLGRVGSNRLTLAKDHREPASDASSSLSRGAVAPQRLLSVHRLSSVPPPRIVICCAAALLSIDAFMAL